MPHSETSTIAIPEEAHAASHPDVRHKHKHEHDHDHDQQQPHPPPHITFPDGVGRDHDQNLTLTRTRTHESHDDTRADLSFPFGTTDVNRGGFTNEYRAVSESGYMPADLALRPVPSHIYRLPQALADPEKARELKQMKLVTWKERDPEDPRNWSTSYRWCTSSSLFRHRLSLTRLYILDITLVCAIAVVQVAFASAVVTGDFRDIEAEFHVGEVVTALSVSLMVVGFGIGPLCWSPLVSF